MQCFVTNHTAGKKQHIATSRMHLCSNTKIPLTLPYQGGVGLLQLQFAKLQASMTVRDSSPQCPLQLDNEELLTCYQYKQLCTARIPERAGLHSNNTNSSRPATILRLLAIAFLMTFLMRARSKAAYSFEISSVSSCCCVVTSHLQDSCGSACQRIQSRSQVQNMSNLFFATSWLR